MNQIVLHSKRKGNEVEKEGEEFKPDIDSTLIRVIMYLFVLNAPFVGVYKNTLTGNFDPDQIIFLGIGIVFLLVSLHFTKRFFGIRFGWDEHGVYKQGVFKYTHIEWGQIEKIFETGVAQQWTESDMLFLRKRGKGKKLFVVKSKTKLIPFEFYTSLPGFKKKIASKLNLEIGDNYNALWDFVVNGY